MAAAALLALVFAARDAAAQSCSAVAQAPSIMQACNTQLHVALVLQPHAGVGLAAGNPVAGASSTLGMRIGSIPRVSVAGRATVVKARVEDASALTSVNVDAAVGIFSGFRLAPTLGGFGSLDAVASAGKLFLPNAVSGDDPGSWAVGVRLGVLRESFTAPGVSITGMYRRIGDMAGASRNAATYSLTENSVTSVRAVVGKRLFVLGATAGIGYDRYKSAVAATAVASLPGVSASTFSDDEVTASRATVFGNVSWTMLILNIVAEGGWQDGGDPFTGSLPANQSTNTEKNTVYGSLAIRLAL